MSKSIYSRWFLHLCDFTKSIDLNQHLETFAIVFVRCSKIILVRYKHQWFKLIVVQDCNFVTKNLKRNCSNSTKTLLFKLIFLLQLVMQSFLRQRLMMMSTKFVAKNSLMFLFIVFFWTFHYANWIWSKIVKSFICCCFLINSLQNRHFFYKTI